MANINSTEDQEVTYITGVTDTGTVAPVSFWTWNGDEPATYGATSEEAKWGAPTAGTGATITYAFAAASNWTATEQNAFNATLALWSAFADVTFSNVTSNASPEVTFTRSSDGSAEGGITEYYPGTVNSAQLGTAVSGGIDIDTSVAGFGPLGGSFSNYGGYPWTTLLHEEGHVLGLGHGGPYDEGQTSDSPQYTSYDTRAYSVMSYNDPTGVNWGLSQATNGEYYSGEPTTPMILDIAALQRIYGLPTSTPFDGGQTFGFHDNIVGPTEPFYDFTINTQPIVTIWDEGTGNTLDVSGFNQASTVDLDQGAFSSVAGLTDNIGIAYGARIDEVVTGPGADIITANPDGDTIIAGSGDDTVHGGAGADQIYGNAGNDVLTSGGGADSIFGGQGNDIITGGSGASYLSGDAGDDTITGGTGADTILGLDGNDSLIGGSGHEQIFGNTGNDVIDLTHAGSSTAYGGQGNDDITASGNSNAMQINGDAGDDTLIGGAGADSLLGGDGNDHVTGGSGAAMVFGNAGDDVLVASAGASTVYGGQGNDLITVQNTGVGEFLSGDLGDDTIIGGTGPDTLIGGGGQDVMTGGGGANVYIYSAISDSTVTAPDSITDFNPNLDHVNLSALNTAQMAAGEPALTYVSAFDGHADEVALSYNASTNQTALLIDADGDGKADFEVLLHGQVTQGGWLIL